MSRPLVVDCFMYNNEADILECRLTEMYDAVDWFVLCDANVDHQDHPKPSHYLEERERFAPWADKIVHVFAKGLPTISDDADPWAREHGQREFFAQGLAEIDGLTADSVILQSDCDEIPTAIAARNVRPNGFVSFTQRGHFWSCRWLYGPWQGTVAARAGNIRSFGAMRDARNICPNRLPNAGWHLSWLPPAGMDSTEAAAKKIGSFCHPEVRSSIELGLTEGSFLRDGYHVDGVKMTRCEIDRTFPRWIREGHCPESWLQ